MSFKSFVQQESQKNYFKTLQQKISKSEAIIYPPKDLIFNALRLCPWNELKVVIIGQDPYHGEGEAHGLAFSVPEGVDIPPSLLNIFKEIHRSLGIKLIKNGDLSRWAKQGVLLLNTVLTVEKDRPRSHANMGWEIFTDNLIRKISEEKSGVVFMLWGRDAQSKKSLIDESKHLVLESSHPSPLSVYRGFSGCDHFWTANTYLLLSHQRDIDWK